jgi:hypothetical protein
MFAEAYAIKTDRETVVVQLVSRAARSIPQLQQYDDKGVFTIPADQAEEVFTLIIDAGVDLQVLG